MLGPSLLLGRPDAAPTRTSTRSRSLGALALGIVSGLVPPASSRAAGPASVPPTAAAPEKNKPPTDSRPPILLELFTSEGCSSCPPADELLAQLADAGQVEDTPVIALELHVDYWNYLGWRDPFSDAAFSQRQDAYVRLLGLRGPSTPQLVVDGRFDVLGSSGVRARAAVLNAGDRKRATLRLRLGSPGDTLHAEVRDLPGQRVTLYVAVTERGLQTRVPKGENAGRTLAHGPIVRLLRSVARGDAGSLQADVPLSLAKTWRREALRVVAFAQDDTTGQICGAAEVPLGPTSATK